MFDERPAGASVGGRSVTMFGDALIIIKSLGVVCVGQIENNRIPAPRRPPRPSARSVPPIFFLHRFVSSKFVPREDRSLDHRPVVDRRLSSFSLDERTDERATFSNLRNEIDDRPTTRFTSVGSLIRDDSGTFQNFQPRRFFDVVCTPVFGYLDVEGDV